MYYVKETGKLSSGWQHKVKSSKFVPGDSNAEKIAKRAMESINEKNARKKEDKVMPTADEVVKMMAESSVAKRGTDWVNQLGPNVFLLYGHKECDGEMLRLMQPDCKMLLQAEKVGVYPLSSAKWLRLAGPSQILGVGKTGAGDYFVTWHCAACCDKWTHANDAEWRLLVAGHSEDAKQGEQAFCAYIGTCLDDKTRDGAAKVDIEKQIQLLKGATLLEKIGDQEVTKEKVLKAIEALNAECEHKLGTMANVVKLRAGNHQLSKFQKRQLYCEDERLSIG